METATFQPLLDRARTETAPRIVLVYEDFESASKARAALPQLLQEFRPDEQIDGIGATSFWKFDLLQYAALAEQAVEEASCAEVILVSMHGAQALPGDVVEWMSRFLARREDSTGLLLILLDESAERTQTAEELVARLRAAAGTAGLEFACVFIGLPG